MAVELVVVPIREISPAKDNPRRKVGDVDELAASIRAVGLLEPLIVTNGGGLYQLVAGARRLAAAKQAGLTRVPVIVRELTESQRQEVMLIENGSPAARGGGGLSTAARAARVQPAEARRAARPLAVARLEAARAARAAAEGAAARRFRPNHPRGRRSAREAERRAEAARARARDQPTGMGP
jgi:ParB-like chromosome segregation protein Spo0J